MVLRTVRSLGSCFETFSYSPMAFCSLPCCTYFSAALNAFALLKPKPRAISGELLHSNQTCRPKFRKSENSDGYPTVSKPSLARFVQAQNLATSLEARL